MPIAGLSRGDTLRPQFPAVPAATDEPRATGPDRTDSDVNDADVDKLYSALSITTNIDGQMTNLLGRGARAGKFWASWLKESKREADAATNMKAALAALEKLLKDAKTVMRDLDKATKAANKATLAKYPTGKNYRDTVLTKQLASLQKWEQNATAFLASMAKVVPPFKFPKSPAALADTTVTYDSMTNYLHYYGEMKKQLAAL